MGSDPIKFKEERKMQLFDGRPATAEGREPKEMRVYDLLDSLGIAYQRTDHAPATTMEVCEVIDAALGCLCSSATGSRRSFTC